YASDCLTIFHKGKDKCTDDFIRTPGLWLSKKKLHARFTGNWDNDAGIMGVGDELSLQKWYHITYTLSDPEKRLDIYVDGEWVGYYSIQDVKKQNVIFNDGPLYIGQAFSCDGFDGEISNVHYFNWRLTPEEVKKDLLRGLRKNEEDTFYYISFDDKSFDDNSISILKLRPFKNNTNAQWKVLRIDNYYGYPSLTDNSPIKDVVLINKGTGKAMKYRNKETGTEITQVDLAEADNNCILWSIGSKQNDGTRAMHLNNNESMSLDGWTGNLVDGCEARLFPTHNGSNQLWTFEQVLCD
ncbi:17512_t:CDS:2, partial [Dentiscutata erythropus]